MYCRGTVYGRTWQFGFCYTLWTTSRESFLQICCFYRQRTNTFHHSQKSSSRHCNKWRGMLGSWKWLQICGVEESHILEVSASYSSILNLSPSLLRLCSSTSQQTALDFTLPSSHGGLAWVCGKPEAPSWFCRLTTPACQGSALCLLAVGRKQWQVTGFPRQLQWGTADGCRGMCWKACELRTNWHAKGWCCGRQGKADQTSQMGMSPRA